MRDVEVLVDWMMKRDWEVIVLPLGEIHVTLGAGKPSKVQFN